VILLSNDLTALLRGDYTSPRLLDAIEGGASVSTVTVFETAQALGVDLKRMVEVCRAHHITMVELNEAALLEMARVDTPELSLEHRLALAIAGTRQLSILTSQTHLFNGLTKSVTLVQA
jgi:hypothetical protein